MSEIGRPRYEVTLPGDDKIVLRSYEYVVIVNPDGTDGRTEQIPRDGYPVTMTVADARELATSLRLAVEALV